MPLARYFLYVGGVLFTLVFILDACLTKLAVSERSQVNSPVIRIHSDRKWPERIVFDTALPTIVPAPAAFGPRRAAAPVWLVWQQHLVTVAALSLRARGLIQRGFSTKEVLMRWIYLGVIILFAAATIIFAMQNFEIITMSVFGFDARVPLAVLVAVAYLLGAATGGSLFALLRRSYEGSRRRVVGQP